MFRFLLEISASPCVMEQKPNNPSVSTQKTSIEEPTKGSNPGTSSKEPRSIDVDDIFFHEETPVALEAEPSPSGSRLPEEEKQESDSTTSPPADQAAAPSLDEQSQYKGKERETQMSYPGDYYHYSRMASGQSQKDRTNSSATDRRPETSRSSTNSGSSSSASTPRQGSEAARDNKKDDRSGGGGGGGGSASASGSRSRLVAGVFVRY